MDKLMLLPWIRPGDLGIQWPEKPNRLPEPYQEMGQAKFMQMAYSGDEGLRGTLSSSVFLDWVNGWSQHTSELLWHVTFYWYVTYGLAVATCRMTYKQHIQAVQETEHLTFHYFPGANSEPGNAYRFFRIGCQHRWQPNQNFHGMFMTEHSMKCTLCNLVRTYDSSG